MSKLTYEQIKDYIDGETGNGCELLIDKYTLDQRAKKLKKQKGLSLSHCKLNIRCHCGEEFIVSFNTFKSRNKRACKKCKKEIANSKIRNSGTKVYQDFIKNGFIPLFKPEDYKNSQQKLPYICKKHKDKGIQYKEYYSINYGCWWCGRDKGKGSNHYAWKGGVSSINDYLRRHLVTWKKDSMKFNKFKCVLTQNRFNDIHHLLGFDIIMKEIFDSNIVPIKQVKEYTEKELNTIENKCIKLNYKYGFGICLCKDIHLLFHKIYLEGNNTPQQFLEFIQRLENHKFDIYLNEHNLKLNINYNILNKLLNQFGLEYNPEYKINK